MGHGGKRPGAGKPKGSKSQKTLDKEAARAVARQIILAELQPMIEAQISNAKGIFYLVVREKTTGKFLRVSAGKAEKLNPAEEVIEIWEKDPSVQAFTDLMNRALDKPKEQEQDVKLDANLAITWLTNE
jgi:hypothetical protein